MNLLSSQNLRRLMLTSAMTLTLVAPLTFSRSVNARQQQQPPPGAPGANDSEARPDKDDRDRGDRAPGPRGMRRDGMGPGGGPGGPPGGGAARGGDGQF